MRRLNLLIGLLSLAAVLAVFRWELNRTSPGPLSLVHRQVEELSSDGSCGHCHGDDGIPASGCSSCHPAIAAQITGGSGFHGLLPSENRFRCSRCHVEHQGDALALVGDHAFRQAGFAEGRAGYDHRGLGLLLAGRHGSLACRDCHPLADSEPLPVGGRRYLGLSPACDHCHPDPHQGAFGAGCVDCHGQERPFAEVASFSHPDGFPLAGAHLAVSCGVCHPRETPHAVDALLASPLPPRDCVSCHEADYLAAQAPDHPAAGFPRTCGDCHGDTTFRGAVFDHAHLPLTGRHRQAGCAACHAPASPRAAAAPAGGSQPRRVCVDCHEGDYLAARRPDHGAGGIPRDCGECHGDEDFRIDSFTHLGFPLIGAHVAATCERCHSPGGTRSVVAALASAPSPRSCFDCHDADYEAARNPAHRAAGFPRSCSDCHGFKSFRGAIVPHRAFPLDGAHRRADCAACHLADTERAVSALREKPLPARACVDCHLPEYEAARTPDHTQAGFPRSCDDCHGVDSFRGATFPHLDYPLEGAHRRAACTSCHENGRYASTPRDCIACHRDDYRSVRRPDHQRFGFPHDCRACHGMERFSGAVFRHRFPIERGKHRELSCADCHVAPATPKVFSCTNCHTHRRAEMDDEHRRVRGYVFDSAACYRCHPTGEKREHEDD